MSETPHRSVEQSEAVAAHIAHCFDALYGSLGAIAPRCTDDGFVVALFEAARKFGEVRALFDELGAHRASATPSPVTTAGHTVRELLTSSIEADPTGALTIYLVTMVVGPRLLISLRDIGPTLNEASEGPLRQRTVVAGGVLVGEIRHLGDVARGHGAIEDESWQAAARAAEVAVTVAGYGESFGDGTVG